MAFTKFRFEVDLGIALKVPFQEVSGMDAENGVIEYRKANSPLFASKKCQVLKKYGNVTMKRGVCKTIILFGIVHSN